MGQPQITAAKVSFFLYSKERARCASLIIVLSRRERAAPCAAGPTGRDLPRFDRTCPLPHFETPGAVHWATESRPSRYGSLCRVRNWRADRSATDSSRPGNLADL